MILRLAFVLALVACGGGAGPSAPTETQAKQALAERSAKIERLKGVVAAELAKDTLEGAGNSPRQVLESQAEAVKDLMLRLRSALEPALTEAGALGARVTLHRGAERKRLGQAYLPPCPPVAKAGSTAPRDGLGWGLYQTAYEDDSGKHGDSAYHPGIIAVTDVVANAVTAEIELCFLTDGTAPPAR